eukprot:UN4261
MTISWGNPSAVLSNCCRACVGSLAAEHAPDSPVVVGPTANHGDCDHGVVEGFAAECLCKSGHFLSYKSKTQAEHQ